MKKKSNLIKIFIAVILVLGISVMQHTRSAVADIPMQEGPVNRIYIDVTYDPNTETYSLGGFSSEELKQFGAPEFQPELWQILSALDSVTLKLANEELNLVTDEAQVATIAWDQASRELLYGMLNAYIELGEVNMVRAEAWLDKADVEFSLRQSKELSDPLLIELATLLQVNVAESGELAVEGFPTGYGIPAEMLDMIKAAEVNNIKLCWNKGVINTDINGTAMPQMTLYEEGVGVIDKAFGLNLGDLGPVFDSSFGAGLVIGEGDPVTGECLP